jgi:hypothetical protein
MTLPVGASSAALDDTVQTSRTYRLDLETNRIIGVADQVAAVRQTVFKILQTERFEYLIYSANYGSELRSVSTEISTRIREALLRDERISDIQDIVISTDDDHALVTFTVVSIYGTFQQEVSVVV